MRICIVTHRVVKGNGQGRVNYEIAAEALKRGADVYVVGSEAAEELLAHPRFTFIPVTYPRRLPVLLGYQLFALKSGLAVQTLRRQEKVDIVLVNGFITWARGDFNAVHFVHSAWFQSPVHSFRVDPTWKRWYFGLYTMVNSWLERVAFRQSSAIIAVSSKVKEEMVELGIDRSKVHVITNGVDTNEFYPAPKGGREQWPLPPGRVVGLFAGDIRTPRKNLDTVLKAMVHAERLHLLVAGDTQDSIYPQLAATLGIEDRVTFLGYRSDVNHLMRQVDLFIFPSRYEACSLVVLEALASGLPVIITEQSGVTEIIERTEGSLSPGFVLDDPDDDQALGELFHQLIDSPEELQRRGEAARQVALSHHWERMSVHYLALFEHHIRQKQQAAVH